MRDPVLLIGDLRSYERVAISHWLQLAADDGRVPISPMSGPSTSRPPAHTAYRRAHSSDCETHSVSCRNNRQNHKVRSADYYDTRIASASHSAYFV